MIMQNIFIIPVKAHIAKMDALPAELVEHVLASSPEILGPRQGSSILISITL